MCVGCRDDLARQFVSTGVLIDHHPNSVQEVREQIARIKIAASGSEEILRQSASRLGHAPALQIPTATEGRILAEVFKRLTNETRSTERTAPVLKNISHSLNGLAHQLEMRNDTDQ